MARYPRSGRLGCPYSDRRRIALSAPLRPVLGPLPAQTLPWPRSAALYTSPFLSTSRPMQHAQPDSLDAPVPLRFLGYMDTLVHFGRFSLAVLADSKIDSWLVAN